MGTHAQWSWRGFTDEKESATRGPCEESKQTRNLRGSTFFFFFFLTKNLLLVKTDGCKCSPEPKLFAIQHTVLALPAWVPTVLNTTRFPSICLQNVCPFMAHQKGSFVLLGAL